MKQRTLKTRLLAMLLVFAMVFGMVPAYGVSAAEAVDTFHIHSGLAGEDGQIHVTYTPEETGFYFLVNTPDYSSLSACGDGESPLSSFDFDDEDGWGNVYELEAGKNYCFTVADSGGDYFAYVKKVTVPADFTVPETATGYVGETLHLDIGFEGALSTEVTSSDETVASSNGGNAHMKEIALLKAGTATITFTSHTGVVHTCEVTVLPPLALTLNESRAHALEAGDAVVYSFTPAADGNYLVNIAGEGGYSVTWGGEWYGENYVYCKNTSCHVLDLRANTPFYIIVTAYDAPVEVAATVNEAVYASDIELNFGEPVELGFDESRWIPVSCVDGNYVQGVNVETSDWNAVRVHEVYNDGFVISGGSGGTATLTVTANNGLSKTIDVVVREYGYDIPDQWNGEVNGEYVEVEFTPETDGYYHLHYTGIDYFEVADSSPAPLFEFEHGIYEYRGRIYQLEAGVTYRFSSNAPVYGIYRVLMAEATVAQDFSVPAAMTGRVHESLWMELKYSGIMTPVTYEITNENVAMLAGSSNSGIGLYLIGEGTADVIATDALGNRHVCTVTVSGEQEPQIYDGWAEFALAAGDSITYYYTPGQSGLYWIYNTRGHDVGIELKENGVALEREYVFNTGEGNRNRGQVYNLTGGTTYELTFTSAETVVTNMGTEFVEGEAHSVEFNYGHDREAMPGDRWYLSFYLFSDYYPEVANVTVTSSNESVIKVESYNGSGAQLYARDSGSADIAVCINGQPAATATISVMECEAFERNETKWITLGEYESVYYRFVPAESGTYLLSAPYVDNQKTHTITAYAESAEWELDDKYGVTAFNLVAGEVYLFNVNSHNSVCTLPVTLTKAETMKGLTLDTDLIAKYSGYTVRINAIVEPELGLDRRIVWSSSDENVARIQWYSMTACNLFLEAPGRAEITASWVDDNGQTQSAKCDVMVLAPTELTLNETVSFNGASVEDETRFTFTADGEGGGYLAKLTCDECYSFGAGGDGQDTGFANYGDYQVYFCNLRANGSFQLIASAKNGTMTVERLVYATDLLFNGSESIDICVGETTSIYVKPADGNFHGYYLNVDASGSGIVDIYNIHDNVFDIFGNDIGTTSITVTTSTGITKTVEVNVHEYGYDIPDKWIGNANDGYAYAEFTPAKDGYYYIHYEGFENLVVDEGSPVPKLSFEYRQRLNGYVFELEGGVTYRFRSEETFWNEYRIFALEVEMAKDFSVPETMTGMVGERHWLSFEHTGVLSATWYSTNEDVVILGDGSGDGVNVFLVGEGTAEIVVTDSFGNERRCTVTVSGTLPVQDIDSWAELALAAGKSVTYRFTPYQSGLYWIRSCWGKTLGMELRENGAVVDAKYAFNYGEADTAENGWVYELTAGTTYEVTFSSDIAVYTAVYLNYVESEAYGVMLYSGTNHEAIPGEVWTLNYDLASDSYPPVGNLEVTSSDPSVVEVVRFTSNRAYLRAVGAGTADILFSINGQNVDRTTMTVIQTQDFEVNSTKNVTMTWGDTIYYAFTPDESGTYMIYVPTAYGWPVEFRAHCDYSHWDADSKYGIVMPDLVAGESYVFSLIAQGEGTFPVTLTKAEKMVDLVVPSEYTLYTGFTRGIRVQRVPDLAFDGTVVWTSSDTGIAEITGASAEECYVYGKAAGKVVLTASWVDDSGVTQTRECLVTVEEPEKLQINEEKTVTIPDGESAGFVIPTGLDSGLYLVKVLRGEGCEFNCSGNFGENGWYEAKDYSARLIYIYPDSPVLVTLSAGSGELNTSVVLEKAVPATDILINGGNAIELIEGEELWIPVEPVNGNYVEGVFFDVSDYSVVEVMTDYSDAFRVRGQNAGTATITVYASGITKSVDVIVHEYGYNIPDQWTGEVYEDCLYFDFTPANGGYYFLHGDDHYDLVAAEESPAPLAAYDYGTNDHSGRVFQLEGGVTYRFRSQNRVSGTYKIFALKVEMAKDFTMPASMSGMVNQRLWLELEYTDTLIPSYASTNEDVVRVGGSNSNGVTLLLIGEGTAEIVVTDPFGNEHRCTVTVSGQLPIQNFNGWDEIGFGAGKSVTYHFCPTESGLYWIYSELESNLDVDITLNGVSEDYRYAYNLQDWNGYVYYLNAGETYDLTFTNTSDVSLSTFINARYVPEEAYGVNYYGSASVNVDAGAEYHIYYELYGSSYPAVGNLQIVSTDESVLRVVSFTGEHAVLEAVAGGTAELKAILNGNEIYFATVTVRTVEPMQLDVPYVVNLAYEDYVKFTFTPAETGNYIVYQPAGMMNYWTVIVDGEDNPMGCQLYNGQIDGYLAYNLKAGETYYVMVHSGDLSYEDRTVTITKSLDTVSISLPTEELQIFEGQRFGMMAEFEPVFGANAELVWTVDNPQVLQIMYQENSYVELDALKAGTATITVTAINDPSITASCTVTVKVIPVIELGKETAFVTEGGNLTYFKFTPDTTGEYVLSIPAGDKVGCSVIDPETDEDMSGRYWMGDGYECTCYTLEGGVTYLIRVHRYTVAGNTVGNAESSLIINKKAETTGAVIVVGGPETKYVGRYVNIELASRPYYACPPTIESVTVSDETILAVVDSDAQYATFEALKAGECTITVVTSMGETLSTTVTIVPVPVLIDGVVTEKEFAYNEEGFWDFVADHDGEYTVKITADNSTPVDVHIPAPDADSEPFYYYKELQGGGYCEFTMQMKAGEVARIWLYSFEGDMNVQLVVEHVHELEHVALVEGTCAADGVMEHYTCRHCDKLFADADGLTEVTAEDLVIKIPHNYVSVVTEPTCTEDGYTSHTCENCGDTYVDAHVDALGHDMGPWIVTKEATDTAEGEETRYCQRSGCDVKETRITPKLNVPEVTKLESTNTGIKLTWKAYEGAGKYRVYIKEGTKWKKVGETAGTSYVYTAAEAGVSYTFTVRAMDAEGVNFVSAYNSVGWTFTYVPAPGITALKSTADGIELTWGAVDGAGKYRVYIKNGNGWKMVVETAETSCVYTAVEAGVTYRFTVRAMNAEGTTFVSPYNTTGWSHKYSPIPQLTALETTAKGIKLTWDPIKGAGKYRVYIRVDNSWKAVVTTTETSYVYTAAEAGKSYLFTVRALDAEGANFVTSYNIAGWTYTYAPIPAITAIEGNNSGVKLTWGAINGAGKYRVYIKEGTKWKKVGETTGTSYTYTAAEEGVTYTFTVRAMDAEGVNFVTAYNTAGWKFTYVAAPEVTGLTSTTGGVELTWDAVDGAGQYRVYVKNGTSWKKVGQTTGTSFVYTAAQAGVSYQFTVRAMNAAGTTFVSPYNTTGWSHTYYPAPEVTGLENTAEGIKLTWGAINGAGKYRVYIRIDNKWKKVGDTTDTSFVYTAAEAGQTYTFTVRALTSDGSGYVSTYNKTGWTITFE